VEIVSPEQLEYRNRVLRKGPFEIDLVYRRLGVQEFLVRFDLTHPAGAGLPRPRGVRGEQLPLGTGAQEGHVRAADGRGPDGPVPGGGAQGHPRPRALDAPGGGGEDHLREQTIDLPEFIAKNRERLALKPNDDYSDLHATTAGRWATPNGIAPSSRPCARRTWRRSAWTGAFGVPADEFRPTRVPGDAGGRAPACLPGQSAGLLELAFGRRKAGFSSAAGVVPTFILDPKS
jgi:hypothetical protein